MKRQEKLDLSEIEVQSFVISLEKVEQKAVKAGSKDELQHDTDNSIFCLS